MRLDSSSLSLSASVVVWQRQGTPLPATATCDWARGLNDGARWLRGLVQPVEWMEGRLSAADYRRDLDGLVVRSVSSTHSEMVPSRFRPLSR